jgi:glutaredoxin-like YruB-family protein
MLLLSCSLAGAEMYKWVEDDGSVTFKDTPPPANKKPRTVKVYTDSDFEQAPPRQPAPAQAPAAEKSPAAPASQPLPAKKASFNGTVELYVTEWCGYCKKAQSYLQSKGVPYVAYDIEKDSAARQRHKELGGRGVPLIIIGANKVSGFSPEAMDRFLNNSR